MNYIKKILEKTDSSIEEFINCLEEIKKNGDVAVIKFDGERKENEYTVFISFPNFPTKEIIRADENNLKDAIKKVLLEYITC